MLSLNTSSLQEGSGSGWEVDAIIQNPEDSNINLSLQLQNISFELRYRKISLILIMNFIRSSFGANPKITNKPPRPAKH